MPSLRAATSLANDYQVCKPLSIFQIKGLVAAYAFLPAAIHACKVYKSNVMTKFTSMDEGAWCGEMSHGV